MSDQFSRTKSDLAPLPGAPARAGDGAAPIPSASLLQGRDTIVIEHNGRMYHLRQTRQGKLILTK